MSGNEYRGIASHEYNLMNAQEAIEEFHLEHPEAPWRIQTIEEIKIDTQPKELKRLFRWQDGKFEPDDLE